MDPTLRAYVDLDLIPEYNCTSASPSRCCRPPSLLEVAQSIPRIDGIGMA